VEPRPRTLVMLPPPGDRERRWKQKPANDTEDLLCPFSSLLFPFPPGEDSVDIPRWCPGDNGSSRLRADGKENHAGLINLHSTLGPMPSPIGR
jgi:hypothetical protein